MSERKPTWQAKLDEHSARIGAELDLACTRIEALERRGGDAAQAQRIYVDAVAIVLAVIAIIAAVSK